MCQAYDFLMSDKCESYRHYQEYRKKIAHAFNLFISRLCHEIRSFCFNGLGVDGIELQSGKTAVPKQIGAAGSAGSINVSTITEENPGKCKERYYKKRDLYFMDPELIRRRTTMVKNHNRDPCKRSRCVWCCENHQENKGGCLRRLGYKTYRMCSICKVPLCNKPRYNGISCFDLWHRAKVLNEPCASMLETGLNVRDGRHDSRTVASEDDEDKENSQCNTNMARRVSNDCEAWMTRRRRRRSAYLGITPLGRTSSKRLKK
jgi:hypothetical protein